ncbi:MAG: hypothetical protein JJT75_09190 [Opitutales bacterium]|nr:hypothetical protein [Opitutales bacterium]MCH8540853.1 hypothetical protein [Opitutales bacterium]
MSLQQWHKNGWLRSHQTNRQQIAGLLAIVERDLADACSARLSSDWQFGISHNAALKLCTILLYAEGYRPERALAHFRTLQALPLILGQKRKDDAAYLDSCRIKRNTVEYDVSGRTSPEEALELIQFATELKTDVLLWLKEEHPEYCP